MGSKGGGSTQQTSEPWKGAQPHLQRVMGEAGRLYSQGPQQFFPGQTFAGPNADQLAGWNTASQYANQVFGGGAAPSFAGASGALNSAMQGGQLGQLTGGNAQAAGGALGRMLSGTPDYQGLQGSIDAANAPIMRQFEQQILPQLNQRATFLGNPTGGIKAMGQILPDMAGRMSENALMATEGERQRALSAQQAGLGMFGQFAQAGTDSALRGAALFPSLAQAGQYPGQLQQAFGDWRAGFQQQAIDEQMARFNFQQNAPWENLGRYNSIIQGFGGMGGQSTTTQPGGSRLGGAAGGALAGAQIGSFIPGIGTAIGAGVGGLLGLFG